MNMKMNQARTIVALLLVIPGVLCAQGTIDFRNRIVGFLDAPVYNPLTGANVGNPDVVVQLYYSSSPSGNFVSVSDPPAPLRTGAGAGYWNPGLSATRVLDGITAGDTAFLQVRVWNAAQYETFEEAVASINGNWSQSVIFSALTGGAGSPPSLPAMMGGLEPIPYIPEPGTVSLGVLGGLVLGFLGWRRKRG